MTGCSTLAHGKVLVRGTTSDNGPVTKGIVNGREAKATAGNFAEWQIEFDNEKPGEMAFIARSEDAAGNVEKLPHSWTFD